MEKQTPEMRDKALEAQMEAVEICRDVYDGTLKLRKRGQKYLPQMEREADQDHRARLAVARLFPAYRRTIGGLVGLVLAKDPQLSPDLPEEITQHAENIDTAGRHIAVFARDHFTNAMIDGHASILVDMPTVEPGAAQTLADERALAGRPYWIDLRKGQILRVRTVSVGGRRVLSRFAYTETVYEDEGEFGQQAVERVRDYTLVETRDGVRPLFRVWSKRRDQHGKSDWVEDVVANPIMSIGRIPVTTTYTHRTGFMESEPPMFDVAELNLNHYQTLSDRTNILRIGSVPVFTVIGAPQDAVEIGANNALILPMGADAKFVEIRGPSLQESREELREIERRMASAGLSQLYTESRGQETATSKRIDKSESDSQLSAYARSLQDALEDAVSLHALWLGLELDRTGDDRWVTVSRDFENIPMDPQTAKVLSDMVAVGQLPMEEMWHALQRGKLLPDGFDAEKARAMLDGGAMVAPL